MAMQSLRLNDEELRVLEVAVKELLSNKERFLADQDVASMLLKKIRVFFDSDRKPHG